MYTLSIFVLNAKHISKNITPSEYMSAYRVSSTHTKWDLMPTFSLYEREMATSGAMYRLVPIPDVRSEKSVSPSDAAATSTAVSSVVLASIVNVVVWCAAYRQTKISDLDVSTCVYVLACRAHSRERSYPVGCLRV